MWGREGRGMELEGYYGDGWNVQLAFDSYAGSKPLIKQIHIWVILRISSRKPSALGGGLRPGEELWQGQIEAGSLRNCITRAKNFYDQVGRGRLDKAFHRKGEVCAISKQKHEIVVEA